MSFLRFLFPFLCRQPQPGDRYVWADDYDNPFNTHYITVIEVKNGWVQHASPSGVKRSSSIRSLLAFYRLVP